MHNDFYHGILVAIAVMNSHGETTLINELVRTVNKKELLAMADEHDLEILRRNGIMQPRESGGGE